MLPLQALIIIQAGFKFLFDVDPSLTDHLIRSIIGNASVLSEVAIGFVHTICDKAGTVIESVLPGLKDLRFIPQPL